MKSSVSSCDLYPLYPESMILNSTVEFSSSRISDTTGINAVPILSSKDIIKTLILRNVGLSGSIPPYIWNLKKLKTLDKDTLIRTIDCQCHGLMDQGFLHINCGGGNISITNSSYETTYEADNNVTTAATNQHFKNWGISNTGEFTDDDQENDYYFFSKLSRDSSELYKTARRSALSLVYYAFCLKNGTYNVKLHFMETQFSDDEPFSRLGRRVFDVFVQGELFLKDFNIKKEAKGTLKPFVKEKKVNVTNHMLEIRLYWAGKGTTLIPSRGNYGPLISAISLCHQSKYPALLLQKP
ncbi:hypothetical protein F2Q70_00030542 [Brassica cretica]|uniref:Malectin domain-containing protein n=1 Tax=Brassica cretica TaxID=69181 RepID=A0A8S9FLR7_BRACR|nr:hypothetical protein F2Q70_00030542 [Brassica cretica]